MTTKWTFRFPSSGHTSYVITPPLYSFVCINFTLHCVNRALLWSRTTTQLVLFSYQAMPWHRCCPYQQQQLSNRISFMPTLSYNTDAKNISIPHDRWLFFSFFSLLILVSQSSHSTSTPHSPHTLTHTLTHTHTHTRAHKHTHILSLLLFVRSLHHIAHI